MFRITLSAALCAAVLSSASALSAPSCFTTPEVEAANLRVLQQQFNVAALNCQTTDPELTFRLRYNQFVERFSPQLQKNGEVLSKHFGKGSGELDRWITHIANRASQMVLNNADFCQVNWDRLEETNRLSAEQLEVYAAQTDVAGTAAPACPPQPVAQSKKKKS
jgi:hypothetical protein